MKLNKLPTVAQLRQMLSYDERTGTLSWSSSPNWSIKVGESAGRCGSKGYVEVSISGKAYKAHRIIWAMVTGHDPWPMEIDHIDRCKVNNRFANLRLATRKLNNENKDAPVTNTSGRCGVSFNTQKCRWGAYVYDFKKKIHLGYFKTFDQAANARLRGESSYAGITATPAAKGDAP